MSPREAEARAKSIAERAALLSPEDGDRLIREETKDFPDGLRFLLLVQSAKLAEEKRVTDQKLQKWGFIAGVVAFPVALILVFAFPKLTPAQWWVIRLMLCLAAGGFSAAFSGRLNVKGTVGVLAVSAGGAIAMFVLTYFINPPSLQPVEAPPVQLPAP